MKITEQQIRECVKSVLEEGLVKDLFFDKPYSKTSREELLSGEKWYVVTGSTNNGGFRRWITSDEELERDFEKGWNGFSMIDRKTIGKIAGPFSYSRAAFNYLKKHNLDLRPPGGSYEDEWSPEYKKEQERLRYEGRIRKELLDAAKRSACDIANTETRGKVGLFKPGATITFTYDKIANGMGRYIRSEEAKKKLSAYFKTGGKEKDVKGAIYGGFKYVEQELKRKKQYGY